MKRSRTIGKHGDTCGSIDFPFLIIVIVVTVVTGLAVMPLAEKRGPFLERMRIFSKRVVNPVVLRFAGSAHSPFAVIRHVGRRSGRAYATPLLLAPTADGFVVELTYGFAVDWYRNVAAAGHCTILWHGREYSCTEVTPVDAETGLQAFPAALRLPLRIFGAQHFVHMKKEQ